LPDQRSPIHGPPDTDPPKSPRFIIPTRWLEAISHSLDNEMALEVITIAIEDELGVSLHDLRNSRSTQASLARYILYRMAHVQFYVHCKTLATYLELNYQSALKGMRRAWRGQWQSYNKKLGEEHFREAYNKVLARVSLMSDMLNENSQVTDVSYIARENNSQSEE